MAGEERNDWDGRRGEFYRVVRWMGICVPALFWYYCERVSTLYDTCNKAVNTLFLPMQISLWAKFLYGIMPERICH